MPIYSGLVIASRYCSELVAKPISVLHRYRVIGAVSPVKALYNPRHLNLTNRGVGMGLGPVMLDVLGTRLTAEDEARL